MNNWAIIGTGNIATTVANEITKSGRHKVTAVYSRTLSKAQKFAKKYGAEVYDDVDKMLSEKKFDSVYIATPHSVHYKYVIKCIEHECPVLCEKSFTVNAQQADNAFKLAKEKKVYVAEAMWTRFNPVIKHVKKLIDEGAIGKIKSIKANFGIPLAFIQINGSDRVYKPEYAGGALLDLGVYPISFSHLFLGKPDSVKAALTLKNGVDYHDEIALCYKDGVVCLLKASFEKLLPYKGIIEGEKGTITIPMFYRPRKATISTGGKRKTFKARAGYIHQFDAVAQEIKQGLFESPFITHKDTVEVMQIMDEIRRQGGLVYPKIEEI